ncbi:lipopolysaccharide biosynthesis protein [Pontibacter sp. Tf4]|uniref:lipopolysaccharide biosynthesis protein n=1 Tax=Pontibacter sp. Tf4 TaxID=2761620 RepID=UPI00162A4449|nr:lipopolysaccharide biosynthesis protein [Pontibacter sp. Tf4]MBB6612719.1 lipopolysaccharide biosynthesis protein [Pontibacter sp. Tf4]
MSQLNRDIFHGTLWSVVGQFGTMIISLLSNIVLARILTPYEFGQVGVIMFFIILANVLTESGLAGALVRKKEVTQDDYSTVFVFNLWISLVCFLLLVVSSGYISDFYNDSSLQNILLVSSLILIVNAFQITQNARLMRDLKFKEKSKYRFVAVCIGSIVGILFAMLGMGVWALVIMQLTTALFTTIILWRFEGMFFSLTFRRDSFKSLYSFGMNTTLASILNTAFDNIYQLILGRYFSISQVGLFFQAKKLQEVPVGIIKSTTLGVVFSSLSKIQDETELLRKTYTKIVLLFTIVMGLLTSILYVYSESLILLLYGKSWGEAAVYIQLLAIASFFYMQEMFNRVIFKVYDQTHKILYLEIVKKVIQSISIIVGVYYLDLTILLNGFVITSILSYLINLHYCRKIIKGIALREMLITLKIILVSLTISGISIYAKNTLGLTGINSIALLPISVGLYLVLTQIIGVADLKSEYKALFNLLKKQPI